MLPLSSACGTIDAHGQVQGFQELGEVFGLVVLDVDLKVIQQVPAVLGDAEQVDPGAVGAAGTAANPGSVPPTPHIGLIYSG